MATSDRFAFENEKLSLQEVRDQLIEAISRWKREGRVKAVEFPNFPYTTWSGMIHKTSVFVEELIARCVDAFLGALGEDHGRIDRPGPRTGMGELVRVLKRLQPIFCQRNAEGTVVIDTGTIDLLDDFVKLRNKFMHGRLTSADQEDAIRFIELAKTLCASALVKQAIGFR